MTRPELTEWPFTTHKRTYRERDRLIVALDQALRNFLIFRWLAGGDGNNMFSDTTVGWPEVPEMSQFSMRQTMSEWNLHGKQRQRGFPTDISFLFCLLMCN